MIGGFIALHDHLTLLLLTSAMPSQLLAIEYIATYSYVDTFGLAADTICHLLSFDKNPAHWP